MWNFLSTGLQNSADSVTLAWFKELQDSAARCTQAMEPLCSSKDSQVGLSSISGSVKAFILTHTGVSLNLLTFLSLLSDEQTEAGAPESRHHPCQPNFQHLRQAAQRNLQQDQRLAVGSVGGVWGEDHLQLSAPAGPELHQLQTSGEVCGQSVFIGLVS